MSDRSETLEEALAACTRTVEWNRALQTAYEKCEAECERLRAALKEPCAECGHIDWREWPLGEANDE